MTTPSKGERELALFVAAIHERLTKVERSNQISRGSIIDHPLDVYDSDEQLSGQLGEQYDGTVIYNPVAGPPPPIPTQPVLQGGLRSVTVNWDGEWEDEPGDTQVVAPLDFARVEVHASDDPDFDAEFADTIVGTFETPRGGALMVPLPNTGVDYTFKFVARTQPGNRSEASLGALAQAADVEASDGAAPATAPLPVAVGQIRQVYLAWPAVPNEDPVVYRIYANGSASFTLTNDNLIAETASTYFIAQLMDLAPPTPLPYTEDTYFCVVPVDADGAGPASAVVAARPSRAVTNDLADSAVTLLKLATDVTDPLANAAAAASAAQIAANNAMTAAQAAQAVADGSIRTYYQTAPPDLADVTNHLLNPSFELAATYWSGSPVRTALAAGVPNSGDYVGRFPFAAATAVAPRHTNTPPPTVPGEQWTMVVWLRNVGAAARTFRARLRFADGADTQINVVDTTTAVAAPSGGPFVMVAVTASGNAGTTSVQGGFVGGAGVAGDAADVAAAMLIKGAVVPTDYWDGATVAGGGYSYGWAGAPHASHSKRYPDSVLGDMWFDEDDGQAYRWTGTTWQIIEDNSIAAALAAAQNAQNTADGKIDSYYQTSPPVTGALGDLWYDTDAGNKPHYCSSIAPLTWTPIPPGLAALGADVTARALGAVFTYYQNDEPSLVTTREGDLWIDTNDNNRLYRRSAVAWVASDDARLQQALTAAGNAQTTADGKIRMYAQDAPPGGLTATDDGDLWIETDAGNRLWRWSGTAWVDARDTTIATAAAAALAAQQSADQALLDAQDAEAKADGKVTAYFGNDEPVPVAEMVNLYANPSYEVNDGFVNVYNASTKARIVDAPAAQNGTAYLRVARTTVGSGLTAMLYPSPIGSSQPVSIRLRARLDPSHSVNSREVDFIIQCYNGGSGVGGATNGTVRATLTKAWSDVVIEGATTVAAAMTSVGIYVSPVTSMSATDALDFDAVMVVNADKVPPYFDGAAADNATYQYAWSGAAHASTSIRALAWSLGDLWFDTNDNNKMYRWDGAAWVLAADQRIAAAVTAAANAQTTANSKITTFYQSTPPVSLAIGDLWVNTADQNHLYRALSVGADAIAAGEWVSSRDASIAAASGAASAALTAANNAMTAAQAAQAVADGSIRTYYQTTPPDQSDRINLVTNPSFEVNVTGWSAGANQTLVRVADATARVGSAYARSTSTAALTISNNLIANSTAWRLPIDPTKRHAFAIPMRRDANGPSLVRVLVQPYDAGGTALTAIVALTDFVPGIGTGWSVAQAVVEPAAWPVGTVSAALLPRPQTGFVATIGGTVDFDAIWFGQIGATDTGPPAYFDGATAAGGGYTHAWSGVAHQSTSLRYPDTALGDMWYDEDDNQAYRWNGIEWRIIEDSSIAAALAAANLAQTTADGKITSYYGPNQPWVNGDALHVGDVGDLWFETDQGNKPWYYSAGQVWTALPTGLAALGTDVTARALGAITTYTGTTAPTPVIAGDMWLHGPQTLNGVADKFVLKRWSGSAWVEVSDAKIEQAVADALAAANRADSKMRIFYEAKHASAIKPASDPVMLATDDGDLWFRSDANNRLYRYNHATTTWMPVGVTSSDGNAPTEAPNVDLIPGLGVVHVRLTPVLNTDPVTYEYHASPSPFTPTPGQTSTLVHTGSETSFTVKRYANAIPVGYTPVYVRVFAKDGDGYGPIAAEEVATPVQITSPDIAAAQGWFGFLESVDFKSGNISGDVGLFGRIATDGAGENEGQGWEAGADGARWFNSEGKVVVDIPANLSVDTPALFQGKGVFQQLEATQGMTMKGISRVSPGATLELTNAQQAPGTAASVGVDVPSVQCNIDAMMAAASLPYPDKVLGLHWDSVASEWLVAFSWTILGDVYNPDVRIARFGTNGVYLGFARLAVGAGCIQINAEQWVRHGTTDWFVGKVLGDNYAISRIYSWAADNSRGSWRVSNSDHQQNGTPGIGSDGTSLYLADQRFSTDPATPTAVVQRIDPANAAADPANVASYGFANPTFETNVDGWQSVGGVSITRSTTMFRTGVASLRMQNNDTNGATVGTEQSAMGMTTVQGGERYDVTIYARANTTIRTTRVTAYFFKDGLATGAAQNVSLGPDKDLNWIALSGQIVAPPGATLMRLRIEWLNVNSGESHYIDDVSVTRAAGPRVVETWGNFAAYTVADDVAYNHFPAGIVRVTDPTLGNVDRFVLGPSRTQSGTSPRPFRPHRVTTGAMDGYAWQMPVGSSARAIARVNNAWVALDSLARIFTFTDVHWTTESDQWWAGYTWRDDNATGSKHETPLGQQTRFTMKKRHRITLTTGVSPTQGGGQDDVTSAGFYLGRNPLPSPIGTLQVSAGKAIYVTESGVPHGLAVGDTVVISKVASPNGLLNGTWTVTSVPTTTEFRVATVRTDTAQITTVGEFQRLSPLPRTSMFFQSAVATASESALAATLLAPTPALGLTNDITSLTIAPDPAGAYVFPSNNPGRARSARRRLTGSMLPSFEVDGEGLGRWDDVSPVGEVKIFAGGVIPPRWFVCNGQSMSMALYPDLYATFGGTSTPFGLDLPNGMFYLPDFRGRFPIGVGTFAARGANEGAVEASRSPRHRHNIAGQDAGAEWSTQTAGNNMVPRASSFNGHAHGGDTGYSGDTGNNAIPFLGINYIIKAE